MLPCNKVNTKTPIRHCLHIMSVQNHCFKCYFKVLSNLVSIKGIDRSVLSMNVKETLFKNLLWNAIEK